METLKTETFVGSKGTLTITLNKETRLKAGQERPLYFIWNEVTGLEGQQMRGDRAYANTDLLKTLTKFTMLVEVTHQHHAKMQMAETIIRMAEGEIPVDPAKILEMAEKNGLVIETAPDELKEMIQTGEPPKNPPPGFGGERKPQDEEKAPSDETLN